MTLKLSDRDVEELLREPHRETRPPADLLARLRAELPAELPLAPPLAPAAGEPATILKPRQWRRVLLPLAASLAVLIGGSLIAYRTLRQSPLPAAVDESRAVEFAAETDAATAAAPPPVPRAPAAVAPAKEKTAPASGRAQPEPTAISEAKADIPAAPPLAGETPTEGVAGAVVGGIALAPPADEDDFAGEEAGRERAATEPAAAEPLVREPVAGGLAKKAEEGGAVLPPVEVPPRLESPGIEANRAPAPAPSPFEDARDREDLRRRLESPTTQGDLARPQAPPAARLQEISAMAAPADSAWRSIEGALAAGRWPTGDEIAAARTPPRPSGATGKPGVVRQRAATEAGDPWVRLREDILDFLARDEKSRRDLAELRRRALRLFEQSPDEEKGPALLRVLNLASGNLPD